MLEKLLFRKKMEMLELQAAIDNQSIICFFLPINFSLYSIVKWSYLILFLSHPQKLIENGKNKVTYNI